MRGRLGVASGPESDPRGSGTCQIKGHPARQKWPLDEIFGSFRSEKGQKRVTFYGPNPNPNPDPDANANHNPDTDANANHNPDTDANANPDTDANANHNPDTDANVNPDTDANANHNPDLYLIIFAYLSNLK